MSYLEGGFFFNNCFFEDALELLDELSESLNLDDKSFDKLVSRVEDGDVELEEIEKSLSSLGVSYYFMKKGDVIFKEVARRVEE